jgi:hypothetical protein
MGNANGIVLSVWAQSTGLDPIGLDVAWPPLVRPQPRGVAYRADRFGP